MVFYSRESGIDLQWKKKAQTKSGSDYSRIGRIYGGIVHEFYGII